MRRFLVLSALVLFVGSTAYAIQVKPWPPQPAQPADLTVTSYAVNSPPVVHCGGQTIVFTVTEKNNGPGLAPAYTTHHFANGVAFCGRSRPALAAGASATYTDACSFYGGPCDCGGGSQPLNLFERVDALNVVTETNEANNQSITVTKTWTCP